MDWNFSLNTQMMRQTYDQSIYTSWRPANIIKVTVVYDGMTYYATLPVVVCRIFNNNYKASLKDYSGFKYVLYNSSGMQPTYDNHAPFEIITEQFINNIWQNVNNNIGYKWFYMGSVWYRNKSAEWEEQYEQTIDDESSKKWLTKSRLNEDSLQKNQKNVRPLDKYNGECVNVGLACLIYDETKQQNNELAWIHIPIHLYFNRFENSALNSWDGNSVNLGGENGGTILAPQAGAGYKDSNNRFTGVVLGTAKDPNQEISNEEGAVSNEDTGLFAYNHGTRTVFIDAKTGKTTLGQTGQAQIIIDPTQTYNGRKVARIQSGNYDTNLKTGLLIDLSTPLIKYGSGNFEVDEFGNLTAKGNGLIAGWSFDDDSLWTGN